MPNLMNVITKGTDSPLELSFVFGGEFAQDGLNNFSDIKAIIGTEEYNLASGKVEVISPTELVITVGDVTELPAGKHPLVVLGYSAKYNDGYPIVNSKVNQYMAVIVTDIS